MQKILTIGLGAILGLLALGLLSGIVEAAPQCNTRDSVVEQLADKYQEAPTSLGVTHNGGLLEVFTSPGGQTWSITITSPQGMTCLVAAGEGWRDRPRSAVPEGKSS